MYLREVFVLVVAGVALVTAARSAKAVKRPGSLNDAMDFYDEPEEEFESETDLDKMIASMERKVQERKLEKLKEERQLQLATKMKKETEKQQQEMANSEKELEKVKLPADFVPNCKRWSLC